MNTNRTLFIASVWAISLAGPSLAQVNVFTDRVSWQQAARDVTTIDFTTAKLPPTFSAGTYPTPPGLLLSGINFSGTQDGQSLFVFTPRDGDAYARGYASLITNSNGTGMSITLKAGTTAFAFDVYSVVYCLASICKGIGTVEGTVDVMVGGKTYTVSTPLAPAAAFMGFVSAVPFDKVTILPRYYKGSPANAAIMNFSFGTRLIAPSRIVLQTSANPSILGQNVTLSATLPAAATHDTPAGANMTFYDGVTLLGTKAIVNGQASLTTSLLASGTHNLRAYFSGGFNTSAAASPVLQQTVTALGESGFQPQTVLAGGINAPRFLAAGDFNGDGKLDLAVAASATDKVSILLGKGDGNFASPVDYALGTGKSPAWIAAGDFNGDGQTDLAISTDAPSNSGIAVLIANGNGTFKTAVNYAAGIGCEAVVVADLNADGIADLVVSNSTSNTVSVLIGVGDGTFGAAANYIAGGGPTGVAAGDFDGDGNPDFAVADALGNAVTILLGATDGTLKRGPIALVGTRPTAVMASDFDGDGRTDLAVINSGHDTIGILLGKGDGTFLAPVNYPVPTGLQSIAIGDFNGDGITDLIALTSATGEAKLLLGNGDGTFQSATSNPVGSQPVGIVVGDFNGDGRPDVAIANFAPPGIGVLLGAPVVVDLTITKTHSGDFEQGQNGATYTITVSNLGPGPSLGTVTVTDTLPAGLTATAISGDGWTCTLATTLCTRTDALAAGASYPSISIIVNVAPDAPPNIVNAATVTGGGDSNDANNSITDPTHVAAMLTILTTALDAGTQGADYSFALSAAGGIPPYSWSVIDGNLPDGLSLASDTGVIAGSPTTIGDSAVVIGVSDSVGIFASQSFLISVGAPMSAQSKHATRVKVKR